MATNTLTYVGDFGLRNLLHTTCHAHLCRHLMAMRRQPVNFPAAHYETAGEAAAQPPFPARNFCNEGSGGTVNSAFTWLDFGQ